MCDQCQVVAINGIACHETGCINSWRHPITNEPLLIECDTCGFDFQPSYRDDRICDDCMSHDEEE